MTGVAQHKSCAKGPLIGLAILIFGVYFIYQGGKPTLYICVPLCFTDADIQSSHILQILVGLGFETKRATFMLIV